MMNRRNAKILVLGAALALALPAVASAQMSRVEGMAIQGDYIKDWSGIFTYTSSVANVGNLVYGELGNVGSPPVTDPTVLNLSPPFDRSVGAVVGNLWEGRLGTWAIHLQEQSPGLGQGNRSGSLAPGEFGSDPNQNTASSFDAMWGKKFGTTSFGLRLNRTDGGFVQESGGVTSKVETDLIRVVSGDDFNLSRNVLGLGAGIGFEMSPTSNVEFGLLWQNRSWLVDGPGGVAEQDGSSAYLVAGRAMWQWQPNIMVVPVVKYYQFDLGEKATPTGGPTTAFDNSRKGWQVGAAGNWTLGSNDLFVLGFTVAQNKLKQQEDVFGLALGDTMELTESFTPQLFAALETHVNSWLTLRFGASKAANHKVKVEAPNGDKVEYKGASTNFESTFDMSLGAGLKFGNLQLDAVLDSNFPNNLPYFISGNTTSNMFAKVTATYPF